ncbi:MAG: MFS transporter [Nitrososphaerales archaeon]
MISQKIGVLPYLLKTSPVYLAVFLMRFSFAFTVVALQYIAPIAAERGVISSAYPIMEMVTGLMFGLLADRVGRKWIVVGGLLISSIVTLSFTFTTNFFLLVLIHGIQGVCAGAIVTCTLASLTDVAKVESRGREMGFYDFCTLGGYGLGFVIALLLIAGNASKAHLPFYFGAAIALLGGLASFVFLKDEMSSSSKRVSLKGNVKKIFKNKKSLTLIATWFVLMILIGVVLTFTREIFATLSNGAHHRGLLPSALPALPRGLDVLLVVAVIFGLMLLGFSQTTLGGLSDRFGREKLVMIGQVSILGLLIVLVALFAFNLNRFIAAPFFILFGLGLLAFTPAGLAELADIAPDTGRGSTMGLYSLTVGAGTVFAPLAGGSLISAYGTGIGLASLFSIGIMIMLGVLVVKLIRI